MYEMKFATNLHRARINCCPVRHKRNKMPFVCVKFDLGKTMTLNHQYKTFLYTSVQQNTPTFIIFCISDFMGLVFNYMTQK
jgi:hypothetical protein